MPIKLTSTRRAKFDLMIVGWRGLYYIFVLTCHANPCNSQWRRLGKALSKLQGSCKGRLQALKSSKHTQETHRDTCWHFIQLHTKIVVLVEEDMGVRRDSQLERKGSKTKVKNLQTRDLPSFSWMLCMLVVEEIGCLNISPHNCVRTDICRTTVKDNARKTSYNCVFCKCMAGTKGCLAGPYCTFPPLLDPPSSGCCCPLCQLGTCPNILMPWHPLLSTAPCCWGTAGKTGALASMLLAIMKQIKLNWLNCCSQGIAYCFDFACRLLWAWELQRGNDLLSPDLDVSLCVGLAAFLQRVQWSKAPRAAVGFKMVHCVHKIPGTGSTSLKGIWLRKEGKSREEIREQNMISKNVFWKSAGVWCSFKIAFLLCRQKNCEARIIS